MQNDCTYLPYEQCGYFSAIVTDYLKGESSLDPFYAYRPSIQGIKDAIHHRSGYPINRALLVSVLKEQYRDTPITAKQEEHLQLLALENTYTVCTAHQPNIFTGYLYFIYKVLHAVKLAETLSQQIPDCCFVPVYYMGSEDADLEELGHIYLDGKKYEWETEQQGAVGRMKVDRALVQLITAISGQLLVYPSGKKMVDMMQDCYREGIAIQEATFKFVNNLFAEYGLLILLPDNRLLKNEFASIIRKELLEQFSHPVVDDTVSSFPDKYKIQAAGRELNLFYLTEGARERIEFVRDAKSQEEFWQVVNTNKQFSRKEILEELDLYPERFSPNVILRPLFQETILPNIAFIGGGGELAYWLELKNVFKAAGVFYPVLVLRNSFLLLDEKANALMRKLGLTTEEIFRPESDILNTLVRNQSNHQLSLDQEKELMQNLYNRMKAVAGNVDTSLLAHTEALETKALQKIEALEKKILRAEKRKFDAQQRQLHTLKEQLFPRNNLQERVENFMLLYAKEGDTLIQRLYNHSLSLEQQFTVLL